jgi:hypothetical protein
VCTDTTGHKKIIPRPFLDTKETPDRTSFEATAKTANKNEPETTFAGQSDQSWMCRHIKTTLLGRDLRVSGWGG